ncbi:zinc finger protein 43-like isoform X1 [Pomacea canaliculata]|uniref:zinc finger protein 43-like isoform X1 n=2 Tax=Pomacea canaliculata TaxID=400727 RepID=UPI000D729D40|nr:zinc finger protein 43-like isoform X1 [Pomacea canaliculata]
MISLDAMKARSRRMGKHCLWNGQESSLRSMPASVIDTTYENHTDARSNTDSIASNHQHLVELLRTNHFRSRSQKGESKNYVINDVCAPFKCGECGARFALEKHLNCIKKFTLPRVPSSNLRVQIVLLKIMRDKTKTLRKEMKVPLKVLIQIFNNRLILRWKGPTTVTKQSFIFTLSIVKPAKKTNGSEVVNVYQHAQSHTEAEKDHMSTIPTLTKMFPCSECSLMVTTARSLRNHMKTHTGEKPFKCEACEKSFGERNALRKHFLRTHSENLPHVCQDCGKGFAFPSELNQHQVIHTGQKAHTCQECKASFTYAKNLHLHMRIHTGERSFSCEVCQKSFRQSSHLHRHIRAHSGERSFLCQDCGKTFTSKDNLDVHYRIHTGERPYRCPSCPATFRLSGSLNLHMNIHTGETFLCDICQKSFKSLQYFKEHKKVHDGEEFLCQECGKTFISKQQLRIHQRIHAVSLNSKDNKIKIKKSYSCKLCNATFTLASNVYRHKKIHMGIKPYSCKICHKQFRDSSCLKSHMRVHFKS